MSCVCATRGRLSACRKSVDFELASCRCKYSDSRRVPVLGVEFEEKTVATSSILRMLASGAVIRDDSDKV